MTRVEEVLNSRSPKEKEDGNTRSRQGRAAQAKRSAAQTCSATTAICLLLTHQWTSRQCRPGDIGISTQARVSGQWFEAHSCTPMSLETSPARHATCRSYWCVPNLNPDIRYAGGWSVWSSRGLMLSSFVIRVNMELAVTIICGGLWRNY